MKWIIRSSISQGRWRVVLLAALFALYGCQNDQPAQAPQANTATPQWYVSLTISGGLSGQNRSIRINHQGVAQFTDHRRKTQKNGQISKNDLNKLAKLVKNYSTTTARRKGKSTSCRDCYRYTISTEYDGRVNRQQVNDLNMDENVRRLIGALKTISSEHEPLNK